MRGSARTPSAPLSGAARRAGGARSRRADPARQPAPGTSTRYRRRELRAPLGGATLRRAARRRYVEEQRERLAELRRARAARVPAREPARARARRRLVRLARGRAASARAGCERCGERCSHATARCSRRAELEQRAGARRSGPRAPGGLPAGAPGSRRRAAVARPARFCRGLGEPAIDGLHEPRALAVRAQRRGVLAPLEGDVLRWMTATSSTAGRTLRVESELGVSWQAQLVLGALPERVRFPGAARRADVRAAGKPAVRRRPVAERALPAQRARPARSPAADPGRRPDRARGVRRRQGVSDLGYERTQEARDLLAHLQASSRPPLLRGDARDRGRRRDEPELERVSSVPAGVRRDPAAPAARRPAAAVPPAPAGPAHACGRLRGHAHDRAGRGDDADRHPRGRIARAASTSVTRSRARGGRCASTCARAPSSDRNSAILSVGALGSGKTTLAQKLQYEAFLRGARVIDCDPKGDHRFHLLEEVAPHVECSRCAPIRRCAGMLDPLRVAPAHLRQDAAVSFLRDLLPARAEPAWETAIVARGRPRARARRASRPAWRSCERCARATRSRRRSAQTLEVYARSGLTQLGFADPRVPLPPVGERRSPTCRSATCPARSRGRARGVLAGGAGRRADRAPDRDVRDALMGAERERLKVFSFDEGWRLLGDPVGRTLLASLQRMGRSELAVPIISTQLVSDALRRRARVAGEPDRRDIRLRRALGGRGRARAGAARAGPGGPAHAPAAAGARGRPLPVPRPPRSGRGDPGRPGRAGAAAGLLDHSAVR